MDITYVFLAHLQLFIHVKKFNKTSISLLNYFVFKVNTGYQNAPTSGVITVNFHNFVIKYLKFCIKNVTQLGDFLKLKNYIVEAHNS